MGSAASALHPHEHVQITEEDKAGYEKYFAKLKESGMDEAKAQEMVLAKIRAEKNVTKAIGENDRAAQDHDASSHHNHSRQTSDSSKSIRRTSRRSTDESSMRQSRNTSKSIRRSMNSMPSSDTTASAAAASIESMSVSVSPKKDYQRTVEQLKLQNEITRTSQLLSAYFHAHPCSINHFGEDVELLHRSTKYMMRSESVGESVEIVIYLLDQADIVSANPLHCEVVEVVVREISSSSSSSSSSTSSSAASMPLARNYFSWPSLLAIVAADINRELDDIRITMRRRSESAGTALETNSISSSSSSGTSHHAAGVISVPPNLERKVKRDAVVDFLMAKIAMDYNPKTRQCEVVVKFDSANVGDKLDSALQKFMMTSSQVARITSGGGGGGGGGEGTSVSSSLSSSLSMPAVSAAAGGAGGGGGAGSGAGGGGGGGGVGGASSASGASQRSKESSKDLSSFLASLPLTNASTSKKSGPVMTSSSSSSNKTLSSAKTSVEHADNNTSGGSGGSGGGGGGGGGGGRASTRVERPSMESISEMPSAAATSAVDPGLFVPKAALSSVFDEHDSHLLGVL